MWFEVLIVPIGFICIILYILHSLGILKFIIRFMNKQSEKMKRIKLK